MRDGTALDATGRTSWGPNLALATLERTIGLQEQLVTRQRRIVEVAVAGSQDAAPAARLLGLMESNLEKLHAWRLRLLDPPPLAAADGRPAAVAVAAAATPRRPVSPPCSPA